MKIAISGSSGFIGSYLSTYLAERGHIILQLGRELFEAKNQVVLTERLSQADIVINLAGAPINHRWTKSYKKKLYISRIDVTRTLVDIINNLEHKPQLFISTSAVGYYPTTGCYDEYSSVKGDGFLSDLCEDWEQEARRISPSVRLCIARLGVVLAPKGGAFRQMALPSRLGISTIMGSGKQTFPWIDITDLANAVELLITRSSIDGIVNFVAPEVITNKELTKKLAKHYRSFFSIKILRIFFQIALGKASSFILEGQCVHPKKLLDANFVFNSSTIDKFLKDIDK